MSRDQVYVVDTYHWADEDDVVHTITKPYAGATVNVHAGLWNSFVHTGWGEARTVCGIRLTNDKYYYTRHPPSCLACIAGDHLGWRSINSNGPK